MNTATTVAANLLPRPPGAVFPPPPSSHRRYPVGTPDTQYTSSGNTGPDPPTSSGNTGPDPPTPLKVL